MPGKTDIRWSDSEWAALERYAEVVCGTPGRAAKWIVCQHLREAGVLAAQEVGSAAPREGEFAGLREAVLSNGANVPVVGGPVEGAASGLLEPGKRGDDATAVPASSGAAASPVSASPRPPAEFVPDPAQPEFGVERRRGFEVGPVGSAGSSVRPLAGGSAAGSAVVEPAVEEGVPLLEACVAVLVGQGVPAVKARLLASREIRAGRVEVSGEVCSDPERLVDPASLGAPS